MAACTVKFSDKLLNALDTWADDADAMTTDQAQTWLHTNGIETQLVGGVVQALDVWTKDGKVYTEWTEMTCKLSALRNWMNY